MNVLDEILLELRRHLFLSSDRDVRREAIAAAAVRARELVVFLERELARRRYLRRVQAVR